MKRFLAQLEFVVMACVALAVACVAYADVTATSAAVASGFNLQAVLDTLTSPFGSMGLQWILLHIVNWGVLTKLNILDEKNVVIRTVSWVMGLTLAVVDFKLNHLPFTLAGVFAAGGPVAGTLLNVLGSGLLHDVTTPPSKS